MSKLQTEISWWFPFGLRLVYTGSPMTRARWMRLTWRGYVALWRLAFRAGYLMAKQDWSKP
jgi:hypothetical protein